MLSGKTPKSSRPSTNLDELSTRIVHLGRDFHSNYRVPLKNCSNTPGSSFCFTFVLLWGNILSRQPSETGGWLCSIYLRQVLIFVEATFLGLGKPGNYRKVSVRCRSPHSEPKEITWKGAITGDLGFSQWKKPPKVNFPGKITKFSSGFQHKTFDCKLFECKEWSVKFHFTGSLQILLFTFFASLFISLFFSCFRLFLIFLAFCCWNKAGKHYQRSLPMGKKPK